MQWQYKKIFALAWLFIGLASASSASASANPPSGLTFQGRIVKPDTTPEQGASVTFTLQILSPSPGSCVLYEESQTLDMTASNGIFSLTLGAGARGGSDPGLTMMQVFSNAGGLISGLVCGGGGTTYTASSGDARNLHVSFNDTSGAVTMSPDETIQAVPYALYAEQLQGKQPTDFIQVNNGTAAVTQANLETVFASAANVTELAALIAGTSTKYLTSSANGAALPSVGAAPGGAAAGDIWYNNVTHTIQYNDGTTSQSLGTGGGSVTSVIGGTGLTGGTITTTGTLAVNVGVGASQIVQLDGLAHLPAVDGSALTSVNAVKLQGNAVKSGVPAGGNVLSWVGGGSTDWEPTTVATALGYTPLNKAGDTMSGALTMGGNNVLATGHITMSAQTTINLGTYTDVQETALTGALGLADAGKTWFNTDHSVVKMWTGSAPAVSLATGGSAISSLNGLTGPSQTFATPTLLVATSTAPAWNSSGTAHTLNIPMASSATVTAGLVSHADYASWVKSDGSVAFAANESMGSHKLTNVTDPASAQDAATKNYCDTHAVGDAVDPSMSTLVTGAAGNGFVLNWDQAQTRWTASAPVSAVTSLGYTPVNKAGDTMGGILTLSGNPVGVLDSTPKQYVTSAISAAAGSYVLVNGTQAFTGDQSLGSHKLTNVTDPASAQDAATKNYSDLHAIGLSVDPAFVSGPLLSNSAGDGFLLTWDQASTRWTARAPASTATNATNVATTQVSTNASYYPLFVSSSANGNHAVDLGTGLTFNPSTNTLATTTFSGALSGNATSATTATNATNVATTQVSTNASYYPLFVSSSANGNQAADLGTGLSFNPSTNALTTTSFVGALTGHASSDLPLSGGTMTGPLVNNSNSASTALAVTQSGAGYAGTFMGGNVGIGTTSPGSLLQVGETRTDTSGYPSTNFTQTLVNPASSSSVTAYAVTAQAYVPASASAITGGVYAGNFYAQSGTTATVNSLNGQVADAENQSTGTVTYASGEIGYVQNDVAGTITNAYGVQGWTSNNGAGTITNAYGGQFQINNSGGGATTNGFGVYIGPVTATNAWSLYSASTANSYFAGKVGIGAGVTAPGTALEVKGTVTLDGSTSGSVTLAAPASGGAATLTLPSGNGSSNQVITTNGSGAMSWSNNYYAVFTNAFNSTVSASTTVYAIPIGGQATAGTITNQQLPMPVAGTLKNFYVYTTTAQPATGSLVFTVYNNNSGSSVVVTIPSSSAAGNYSDTTHTLSVAAGDLISIKITNNATGASASLCSWSLALGP